jgi:spore coat polysaccharide biosynthesis protein SpsF
MKKKFLIILQARCSSKRFPEKVLKKINKFPLVILAYKRLANLGRKVIVATSKHKSDDKLIRVLNSYNVPYFRGSLKNVLSRFQNVTKKLNSNDIIIRATSDNVLPDGKLVEIIYKSFIHSKKDYIQIDHKLHNLPKGIRLEIFTKKILHSLKKKLTQEDKEHVTYKIYKNKKNFYNYIFKTLYSKINLSNINLSIDTPKEYHLVKKIFKNQKNPINVPFNRLLDSCAKYK